MSPSRVGNFTSSEIAALMSEGKAAGTLGKPAKTYITECNWERKLGRSITNESNARALTWGKLCEKYILERLLGIEYRPCSQETIDHPTIPCWKGSPDTEKETDEGKTVADAKAPMTLTSFCQLVEPLYQGLNGQAAIDQVRNDHKDGDKYYYQLISNAILTGSKYAELIVFCPYFSELNEIRALAQQMDGPDLYKYYWIANAANEELPWIPDGGFYRNLNVIKWTVSEEDKAALTNRVLLASSLLIDVPQTQAA